MREYSGAEPTPAVTVPAGFAIEDPTPAMVEALQAGREHVGVELVTVRRPSPDEESAPSSE